jgi:RimJ/RimL family protein N-acetyltransferase
MSTVVIAPREGMRDLEDPVDLETVRMLLRPLVDSDVDDVFALASDPELPRLMSWAAHSDRSVTAEWILRQAEGRARGTMLTWGIEKDGHIVGCIGLSDLIWQQAAWRKDVGELGYWLAPALWGQGLMTEAARAVIAFGFDDLGLHKIKVAHLDGNAASRKVIEKCGFRFVGRREEDVWRDERWYAHLLYELTITEWADTTATRRFFRRQ